jgi:hypothetical protein
MAVSNCATLTFLGMFYPHELYLFPSLNNPFAIPGEVGKILGLGFTAALLWLMVTFLIALASLLVRFRRAEGEECQQLKWIFSAFLLMVLLFIVTAFLPEGQHQTVIWGDIVNGIGGIALPIALGIAILRYRLWDIDIIINRTLVYGLLTATLLVVYLALVFAGQVLLSSLLGPNNGVVLVGSTLVVAALFQPLRHRIQQLIDRRFYRRKYDAQKTLAAFSTILQGEVDLDQLREQLLAVVEETMQPAHLSLWIRPLKQQAAGGGIKAESAAPVEGRPDAD